MPPCFLFDLGDTLLTRQPHLTEELELLWRKLWGPVPLEQIQRAYASAEAWTGRQIVLENQTNERMPDGEFIGNIRSIYTKALGLAASARRYRLSNEKEAPAAMRAPLFHSALSSSTASYCSFNCRPIAAMSRAFATS